MRLPADLDPESLRFLEEHETRVHALPGREIRDLGDAIMLHDPIDREPFWNRVGSVRWPDEAHAFERRLAETIALFGVLDRIPHVWPSPAFNQPADLAARLVANGWDDAGGGLLMVLADGGAAVDSAVAGRLPPGVTLERYHGIGGDPARRAAADLARVLGESFDVEPGRETAIELETLAMWDRTEMHGYLVRVDGEPAAAAKRASFDGASYLSSIGTRPAFRGRGLGRLVTAAASADSVRAGSRWTYLGVFAENEPALRLYRGLGYEPIGEPAPDLVLR